MKTTQAVGRSLRDVSVDFPLCRWALARLRLKAVRRGVWFRELKDTERKLFDLTIAVVRRVHSARLAKMVSSIVERLLGAVESRLSRLMRTTGRGLAENLSRIAQSWGNKSAEGWRYDRGFARFLTICSADNCSSLNYSGSTS